VGKFGHPWVGNWRVYGEERVRAETAIKLAHSVALTVSHALLFLTLFMDDGETMVV
jgi:hypothetical protein